MKNKNLNLAFLRLNKVTKGNYIRRVDRTPGANRGKRARTREYAQGVSCGGIFYAAGGGRQEGGGRPEWSLRADVRNPLKVAGSGGALGTIAEDGVLEGHGFFF